jgi:hypothetical protein
MAEPKFKTLPFVEDRQSQHWTYPREMLENGGPYGEALRAADERIRRNRSNITYEQLWQFRGLLVHECEMAKSWRLLWDSGDDPQRAMAGWASTSNESLTDLTRVIGILRTKDRLQGYALRQIFLRAPNSPCRQTTSAPVLCLTLISNLVGLLYQPVGA